MSTGKRLIFPFPIIGSLPSGQLPKGLGGTYSGVSGDMAQASITSLGFNVQNMDHVGIQMTWPTSGVGTIALYGSSYNGGYQLIPNFSVISPNGSNTGTLVELLPTSLFWIQLIYTKTSGTGTLNAWCFAKAY